MDKKVLLTVIGIILLIASGLGYVLLNPDEDSSVDKVTKTTQNDSVSKSQVPPTVKSQAGAYVDYSEEAFASTAGTKLLFFHAPWCPQCRELETTIKAGGVPSGVTVFKIDYDSNQSLRQKYGVTLQTTFVKVDDQGNKVASYVAYEEPQFSSVERELLP